MKRLVLLFIVLIAAFGLSCQSESDSGEMQAAIADIAQSSGYVHLLHF